MLSYAAWRSQTKPEAINHFASSGKREAKIFFAPSLRPGVCFCFSFLAAAPGRGGGCCKANAAQACASLRK
jgi:hypothetical protein